MSWQNRERKLINLDIKKEIIAKLESGKSVGDLGAEYGLFMLFKFTCTVYKICRVFCLPVCYPKI